MQMGERMPYNAVGGAQSFSRVRPLTIDEENSGIWQFSAKKEKNRERQLVHIQPIT